MTSPTGQIPEPTIYQPPTRLDSDEAARAYIDRLDFRPMVNNMVKRGVNGETWSMEKIEYVEQQYRNWLYLKRKHPHLPISPSYQIDQFWHGHMLDTRAYFRDTAFIFGAYLHHFPYFGMRGTEDSQALQDAWDLVQDLYEAEFGEAIYDFEDEDEDGADE